VKFAKAFFREVLDDPDRLQRGQIDVDLLAQCRAEVTPDGRRQRFVAHYPPADKAPARAVRGRPLDKAYPGLLVVGERDEIDTENRHVRDYEAVLFRRYPLILRADYVMLGHCGA
jgi:hypothetical protein